MLPGPEFLIAFTLAAALLTITPGLDTALVLRTAASDSPRHALMAGIGIAIGCIGWGAIVAVGLGALLAASELAYTALRWIGAGYLFYLGWKLLRNPRHSLDLAQLTQASMGSTQWLGRGFLTNILNPKVGVFYVSFLPQFIPNGANVMASTVLLAAIHAALGIVWSVALIAATRPLSGFLKRGPIVMWLDRLTGGVFIAFGLRLIASNAR